MIIFQSSDDSILKLIISKQFNLLNEKAEEVTAEKIKNICFGKRNNQKTLIEVFKYHNGQMESLIGENFALGTLKRYKITLTIIQIFLKFQYNITDINLNDIKYEFLTNFEFWLKTERKCAHNTTIKYIKNLRKIINIAIKNEWMDKDPFAKFVVTSKEVKRVALTKEELEVLEKKEIKLSRISQVRDIFIFCCYTGLAYSDVEKLEPNQIKKGIDGKQWIFIERSKTKTQSNIPLLPASLSILEKYRNSPETIIKGKCLPVLSNQRMNSYLKEIADICGIEKDLTTHLARHTFATTVTLTNGVTLETVSNMLGHRSIRTTQIYAKVVQAKVSTEMELLEQKLTSLAIINN